MGVEIISDEKGAVFVCNTSDESFGPRIIKNRGSARDHRELAKEVLKEVEKRKNRDIRSVDEDYIKEVYFELKLSI